MTTTHTALLGDRTVRRVGFGAMQLAGPNAWGPPRDPDAARAVLRRALDLGVNHVDTAQIYGPDVVNDLIAEALRPYPDELVIATKVGGRRDDGGGWIGAARPERLRADVEANLRGLRVERLGLVNLRLMPDGERVPLAEQLGALTALRDEGKLALIGLSTVSADDVRAALEITPIAAVQNAFSVVNRADQPVLDLCRAQGIAYVPYFPLGSAYVGGPQVLAADPAIASVAAKHGVSAAQVALAWLLARYDRMLLIPGTSSIAHLEDNLAAGHVALDDQDLATLDGAKQLGNPMG
ncbi:aldo/keto reductase [Patulibacter americanus]|uniref:aldo/keto reductase n=1 Tax=Patulibacter americanus TaxID=588672 RepID=UPI0003B7A65F|nr:aldo/keto reductase [Patulibacter americanus]